MAISFCHLCDTLPLTEAFAAACLAKQTDSFRYIHFILLLSEGVFLFEQGSDVAGKSDITERRCMKYHPRDTRMTGKCCHPFAKRCDDARNINGTK